MENTFCEQKVELVQWLRGELCCKEKELFIVASHEVERSRTWSLDDTASNGISVSLPSEQQSFTAPGIKYIEEDALSIENTLDKGKPVVRDDTNGLVTENYTDNIKNFR